MDDELSLIFKKINFNKMVKWVIIFDLQQNGSNIPFIHRICFWLESCFHFARRLSKDELSNYLNEFDLIYTEDIKGFYVIIFRRKSSNGS